MGEKKKKKKGLRKMGAVLESKALDREKMVESTFGDLLSRVKKVNKVNGKIKLDQSDRSMVDWMKGKGLE